MRKYNAYEVKVFDELHNKYIHPIICMGRNKDEARRAYVMDMWTWLKIEIKPKHRLSITRYTA